MERFEGHCHLDWWANSMTLLASVEVAVAIATTDTGWSAEGRLLTDDEDEREGFAFLCEMDPVFELRFEDESTITVNVHPAGEVDRFTLTEYAGPESRSIE
ncbi:hypothetical protein AB0M36_17220 [Actinoplanes sp. NPDC051346]|uniref:hypothetical protein n=1 Tax=Actinoplanes sp. NPDC051346 TaxID=3155048 RepID=UPI0034200231